jgi:hypothetical protein
MPRARALERPDNLSTSVTQCLTVELMPQATVGMAIGAQVAQPYPAAMVTGGVGTKVHRGVDLTRASVSQR